MKKWILKPGQESFEVVDGKLAGRKFQSGKIYSEIPESEEERFEVWAVPEQPKTTRKGKDKQK